MPTGRGPKEQVSCPKEAGSLRIYEDAGGGGWQLPGRRGQALSVGGVECFAAVERREDSAADLSDRGGTKEQTNKTEQNKQNPGHLKDQLDTGIMLAAPSSSSPHQAPQPTLSSTGRPCGHCQELPHTGGGQPDSEINRCKQQSPNLSCLPACLRAANAEEGQDTLPGICPEEQGHGNDYRTPGDQSGSNCPQGKAAGMFRPTSSVRAEQAAGAILLRRALGHWLEALSDQVIKFIGRRPESKGKARCWGLQNSLWAV